MADHHEKNDYCAQQYLKEVSARSLTINQRNGVIEVRTSRLLTLQ